MKFRDFDSTGTQAVTGVSLADEETIFNAMELLCTRVRNMIDIINTLGQFTKLCQAIKDLPRLPKDALVLDDEVNEELVEDEEEPSADIPRTLSDASADYGMYKYVIYIYIYTVYTHILSLMLGFTLQKMNL